jgi:ABC-type multidrug transport system permease subunit
VPAVAGIVTLLALAVSATATALMLAWPAVGAMIASILLLIIGTASAGAMPGPMLPDWLHIARDVLPNGLALDAIRQVEYFDSHGAIVRTLGLAIWAAIPVGLITLRARRQET